MAKKTETPVKEKKKTMDLLDLANGAKATLDLHGEVEFSKIVLWDNTGGQQGVIKASYLNIIVRDKSGKEAKFIIGAKEGNLWVGKEIAKREGASDSKIEL